VKNILKEVKSELEFLKDPGVDKFAQQLIQREQEKLAAEV